MADSPPSVDAKEVFPPIFAPNRKTFSPDGRYRKRYSPEGRSKQKSYQVSRSPILEVRSKLNFGTRTPDECLPGLPDEQGLARASSFLSNNSGSNNRISSDVDNLSKFVPFGRSRRMSKSLPELRDIQFVSVLPDLEEEESDSSEYQGEEIVYVKPTKVSWHRKLDFLWTSACHALGLANLWRFPYYCYSNGGGSFFIPYLVFMVACGVPFLCMELAIGQATQSGPISAIGQLCPLMKGIGVASMMLSFWLTAYYSVLTAWTMFYVFNSFYSPPRWTRCTNTWNTDACRDVEPLPKAILTAEVKQADFKNTLLSTVLNETMNLSSSQAPIMDNTTQRLQMFGNMTHPADEFFKIKLLDKSDRIEESGELRFEVLASVLFVWILTYFALRKKDFFRGTAIYAITILSHLVLLCTFLRTVGLDGAKTGLAKLFQPEWDKMFSPRVLLMALAQAFHSLGVVLGPSILMGSCHKQHNNLLRDTIVVTGVTLLTVLMVGCMSFATIGHLATKLDRPFWTVLSDDPGSVYVVYSIVIGSMPLPSCWGVLFFLIFLFFGLDSEIKLMATLISALKEAYTYYIKQRFQGHSMFLAVICGFCFFASIPYLTQAGIFFFQLTDYYIAVFATIVVSFFEVCTLSWIYGVKHLSECIRQMTGKTASYFYQFSWVVLSPVTILAILIFSAIKSTGDVIKRGYVYPKWAHIIGWLLVALTLCWIPFLAIAAYRKTPEHKRREKLKSIIQPRMRSQSESMWAPKPVIIMNGSTTNPSEFPDYTLPELPTVPNAVQSYVDKHSAIQPNAAESIF